MEETQHPELKNVDLIDFDELGEVILNSLSNHYIHEKLGKNLDDFYDQIFDKMVVMSYPIGDFICNDYYGNLKSGIELNRANVSMLTSCAYVIDAERAREMGDIEKAWRYMAAARYWHGVMCGIRDYNYAFSIAEFSIKERNAKSGGHARARRYLPLKNEAYRLVDVCRPNSRPWKSVSHARENIKNKLFDFARLNKHLVLSDQEFVRTFANWMKQMPDFENYFEKKQKVND